MSGRAFWLISCAVTGATLVSPALASAQSQTNLVTVVGCVNRAEHNGSIAGGPGVPPVSPSAAPVLANTNEPTGVFLLSGATAPTRAERGTSGVDAGKETTATPLSYVLDGQPADFEPHLGHQVEVTGSEQRVSEGAQDAKTEVRHLRVTSIKMLSQECPKPASKP